MGQYRRLFRILLVVVVFGCTSTDQPVTKTLSLSLSSSDGSYRVSSYKVLDNTYKKSRQQGRYQAHLLDDEQNILRKISFEKLNIPNTRNGSDNSVIRVGLPLEPDLHQIVFYRLDGRSGHYQLKTDNPLLTWTLPESLRKIIAET